MPLTGTQVIDRLTLGATPELNKSVRRLGVNDWLSGQLEPGAEPAPLRHYLAGIDALTLSPAQLFKRYWVPAKRRKAPEARKRYARQMRELYFQVAAARLRRACDSPWQLRELLVDFWFNHFNIYMRKGMCIVWTGSFENQAIRPHVLGRFSDMLLATARHPAMLFYLDNWLNFQPRSAAGHKKGFNENYAREVMELHTVGLHYHQHDVIGATHLLTGWGLRPRTGFGFFPNRHDFSGQIILGRRFAGGESAITDFLHFLATHPDTAQHISFRLAQYFVADRPPANLVAYMRARFLKTGGDLQAVTHAMIEHPDFARAAARRDKFRTPYRYVLALLRASGLPPENSRPLIGTLGQLGQPLYNCVTPNGWASTRDEWLSPDALTSRLNFAIALGGGFMPISQPLDEAMMDNDKKHVQPARRRARRRPVPVNIDRVLEAVGPVMPRRDIAVARLAPKRLQAAVLLGSPQMQYC